MQTYVSSVVSALPSSIRVLSDTGADTANRTGFLVLFVWLFRGTLPARYRFLKFCATNCCTHYIGTLLDDA